MKQWQKVKVGDFAEIARGSSPRPIHDQRYFEGGTIPWIKIADATKSGKYLYSTNQYVNEFGASFSRRLPAGSLIIAASGTLGYTQFLGVEGCVHDGWLYFKSIDHEVVSVEFLYYLFKYHQNFFYNSAYGAAIQNVNTMILTGMEVSLPPLHVQNRIAAILSAYDDLIENNSHRTDILEAIARDLYREWFVNFRFPGHDGRIYSITNLPPGWEVRELGEIAVQKRKGIDPLEVDPNLPYIGLEHIPRKSIALSEWGRASEVNSTKLIFKKGDILFGKIRPYFHKVAVAPLDGVASSDAIVIAPREPRYYGSVLFTVSNEDFVAHATQTSQGTKMPRANWDILVKFPVVIPDERILERFNDLSNDVIKQIHNLVFRNIKLRESRDLLLPRLISGELDVSELDIDVPDTIIEYGA